MDPEKTPDSPLTPDNRRRFMKRSLAAGIVASQPTLLTGLIRAQGGGGGTGGTEPVTTEPWEGSGSTDPWETTQPPITTAGTTAEDVTEGMLCTYPPQYVQTVSKTFTIYDASGASEDVRVVIASATRKKDPPGATPYQSDVPSWVSTITVYQDQNQLASGTQTRDFSVLHSAGIITSSEPSPPPQAPVPGSPATGEFGLSVAFSESLVTAGGKQFNVRMETNVGGGGENITLYQKAVVTQSAGGPVLLDDKENIKNLEYDPS